MAAGGDLQAERKIRLLSGNLSGDAMATWVGARGSSGDDGGDGAVNVDDASMAAVEIAKP